jgi:tRNA(Arg) A34 adenosine deaminase TadA
MNQDEKYMKIAIKEARRSQENGGAPTAAVIVEDGKVIAIGWSVVGINLDPSGHSELEAIKNACKELNTLNLKDCTMYSTIETCSMCLGCAGWTGLSRIVFGAYKEDFPGNPYNMDEYHVEEESKRMTPPIEVAGGVLREECAELMQNIENWTPKQ